MDLRLFPRRRGLFGLRDVAGNHRRPAQPEAVTPTTPPADPGPSPAQERVRNYVKSISARVGLEAAEVAKGRPARKYAESMGVDIDEMTW